MTAWRIPDGYLDQTHNWASERDRVEYERAFEEPQPERQKMAMAMLCADPATPESFIRRTLMNASMPPRYGYTNEEPTLDDVFSIGSARSRGASPGSPQGGAH